MIKYQVQENGETVAQKIRDSSGKTDTEAQRSGSFGENRETVAQKIRDSSGKTEVTQGKGHIIGEMETFSWKLKTLQP
jgi:hypothetical protein